MTSSNSWRARRASPWPLPPPTCVCVHMPRADRRLPHLCRDWSDLSTSVLGLVSPCHICAGTGFALPHRCRDWSHLATSAPGLGSPCHICAGTRLTLSTSVPGLGAPLPHLHRECAHLATSAPGLGAAPSPATTWVRVSPSRAGQRNGGADIGARARGHAAGLPLHVAGAPLRTACALRVRSSVCTGAWSRRPGPMGRCLCARQSGTWVQTSRSLPLRSRPKLCNVIRVIGALLSS